MTNCPFGFGDSSVRTRTVRAERLMTPSLTLWFSNVFVIRMQCARIKYWHGLVFQIATQVDVALTGERLVCRNEYATGWKHSEAQVAFLSRILATG